MGFNPVLGFLTPTTVGDVAHARYAVVIHPIGEFDVAPGRAAVAVAAVDRKETGARAVVWWRVENKTTAEPLRELVGMLDEDAADRFRERTQEVRNQFDREILGDDAPEREA